MRQQGDPKKAFVQVAEKRVNNILDDIRRLGQMSTRAYYEYDNSQIERIFAAIRAELDKAERQFSDPGKYFRLDRSTKKEDQDA